MLFLDEPTAGVDPVSRREFWDLIYALAGRGVSVLATTHYMDEAEYCNTIAMMYQGQIIAHDSPESLKRQLPGQLLELDCDQAGQAMEVAAQIPGILDVTLHGVLLHIRVAEAAQEQALRQRLDAAGVQVRRLDRILPSLEDVFLALVEVQDRLRVQRNFAQGEEP
jgi:ABC-2 type transport system ATP-binding protein